MIVEGTSLCFGDRDQLFRYSWHSKKEVRHFMDISWAFPTSWTLQWVIELKFTPPGYLWSQESGDPYSQGGKLGEESGKSGAMPLRFTSKILVEVKVIKIQGAAVDKLSL